MAITQSSLMHSNATRSADHPLGELTQSPPTNRGCGVVWGLDCTGLFFFGLLFIWLYTLVSVMVKGRGDLWPVIAGMVFFQMVNFAIGIPLTKNLSLLPRLPRKSLSVFTNTAVSMVHSSIISVSVAGLVATVSIRKGPIKMFSYDELFSGIWSGAYTVLCFSCGYFAYDQWDMLYKHLYSPRAPSLLMHHALLLTCFTLALYRKVTINYLILTLVCEMHSIFLHLRRVLRMAGLRQQRNALVSLEWNLNWLTFFMFRLCVHIGITIKLLLDASKFPSGITLPLALSGMVGLNLLNIILGSSLYNAYKKERFEWKDYLKEGKD
eukprot:c21299_g1_i1 orf=237-1205(-)